MLACLMHKHSGIFEILLSTTLTKVGRNLSDSHNLLHHAEHFNSSRKRRGFQPIRKDGVSSPRISNENS